MKHPRCFGTAEGNGEAMALTHNEFDVLEALAWRKEALSQRALSEATGKSPATVNRILKQLTDKKLIKDGLITPSGKQAMKPYRVKRAVFIAAGFGSRLVPITLNTPKPLVRVKGERIIDSLLDAVLAAGIEEIHIVRGYLGEQFDQLLYKYPMIHFIENPDYRDTNNISSALYAREYLQNAYVFEADTLLLNQRVIKPYQYCCNYLAYPVERTDDWCFEVRNGIIRSFGVGGTDCWFMSGLSYWDAEAGAKLAEHIPQAFASPGNKERLWDYVPLDYYRNEYEVEVRRCDPSDFQEIDNLRELQAVDPNYRV